VVRLGAKGDIVHALPAVASLKESYTGSHVTWVIEPQWAALARGSAGATGISESAGWADTTRRSVEQASACQSLLAGAFHA